MRKQKGRNKFTAVLAVEVLCIVFLLLRCLGACRSISLGIDSFEKSTEAELSVFDNSAVGAEAWPGQDGTQQGFEMLHCKAVLGSGAYSVRVLYDSASSWDEGAAGWAEGNIDCSAGSLHFYTENGALLKAADLRLADGQHEAGTRIWLRPGSGETEVWPSVWHTGGGRLAVRGIQIEEKRIYRVALCAAVAVFFAFCDFLYLVFAREKAGRSSREMRWAVAGALGVTLFASIPYLADFLMAGHDLRFHLARIVSLAQGLREMQVPHRMQFDMLNGYGYASPLFYGELFLLLPAVLYNFYVPVQACYQVFVVCVNLCTCLVSFWCFARMAGDWKKGMFGSFLYTLCAYRMTNVMVRAAVGEYTAMVFLPLFVYGFWCIYTKRGDEKVSLAGYLPLALAASGLVNSHILSCGMVAVFTLFFVLLGWKETFRANTAAALAKSGVLALLLNLWYVVPFAASMRMDVNVSSRGLQRIESGGVYPVQLFGVFHTASGENVFWGTQHEMPLALGLLLFLAVSIQKEAWGLRQDADMKAARACMVLGMAAAFMASSLCWWDNLEGFGAKLAESAGVIQFPWRYLGVASVLLAAMLLFLLRVLERHMGERAVWGVMAVIAAAAVFTEGYFMMDYVDVQEETRIYTGSDLGTMVVSGAEYKLGGTDLEGYKTNAVLHEEGVENISFSYGRNGVYYLSCENKTGRPASVDVPVQMYDNYHAYQDGEELPLSRGENNRARVLLPAGFTGTACIKYKVPLVWRVCEAVSCVTFFVLLGVLVKTGCARKKMGAWGSMPGSKKEGD